MSIKVRYITPFATDGNIGREYNQVISELPADCYIVLRDGDTMFLTPEWGKQIEEIIKTNPEYDIIGCMTNRLGVKHQLSDSMFNDELISNHIQNAIVHSDRNSNLIEPCSLVAGMLMIFHKSVWSKIGGFAENTYLFDRIFCAYALKHNMKLGIAKGLYILHLYRWNQENPQKYKNHLLHCQK